MAQNAPPSQDVQDIQFKIHDKFNIFPERRELKSLVSLLAVSSAKGLLFAGNANAKEFKVIKLRDIVDSKNLGQDLKIRNVPLPGEPKALSCSCDGSMLAINYMLNNTGFLQIYQVDSFLTPNLNSLYNLPVAAESNVFALQLLWNPVIPNNIALILADGSVAMYTLNPGGQYDKVTLSKEHQVKSGCWSPKGKQIVFGFAIGKLQQFKPNLQPARAIACPPGLLLGPFDCIAVHWLSTFQFAVIFLQRGPDMSPSLFIVNAPKAGPATYINYFDVCYSAPGPRIQQLSFTHIAQWNLLLVTSANGVEIGILGTRESGETPTWIQYTLLDEARIEMPLTESKDETFPVGFAYDTASSHQVALGEKKLPIMPMIHVLSTHGHLISFNFLNLSPTAVDVCSPPPPLNDISGQFKSLNETMSAGQVQGAESLLRQGGNENVAAVAMGPPSGQGFGDATFSVGPNMVTSTPAIKDKPVSLYSAQVAVAKPVAGFGFPSNIVASPGTATTTNTIASKPAAGFGFGAANTTVTPNAAASFVQPYGNITTGTTFGNFAGTGFGVVAKQKETVNQQSAANQTFTSNQASNANKNVQVNKPLYTVPSTFTPPTTVQQTMKQDLRPLKSSSATKLNLNTGEIDEVVKSMIYIQIEAFETELKQIQNQSKKILENIGSPNELKSYTKQLNDLQEIVEQADDHEFEQDVQSLRHSMNESYAMLAECRTKLDLYNNPNLTRLSTVSNADPINRRQLTKLQAYVASNQTQLSQLDQIIDAQWSQYQDVVRRNSKNQMHIPCLDGIYQRMSKLKDLLSRQRTKMNYIKSKLKQKGLNYKPPNDLDVTTVAVGALTKNQSTMDSLADSILSMSLSQVVFQTHAKLSEDKLNAIREFTRRQQQITIIKPKRPDRVGLKSEVILETKLQTEKKQKEMAKQQQQQQLQQQIRQQQQQYHQQQTFKPTQQSMPTKAQQQAAYQIQLQQQQQQQQQQFHKPQATIQSSQYQQQPILAKPTASKPSMPTQPATFITPTSSTGGTLSFGGNSSFVKTSTSALKSEDITKPLAASSPFQQFGKSASSSAGLSFGQPKPLTSTAPSESKENIPTNTPISFSAKVIGGNDAKSFASLGNKSSNNMAPQGFAAPISTSAKTNQGFTAFSANKSSGQEKEIKKSEDVTKPFDFSSTITSSTPSTAPTSTPAFGGFSANSKPSTSTVSSTSGAFTTPLFGSTSNASTTTPFGGITSSSTTPFAASSSFSFNTTAASSSSTIPAVSITTTTKTIATTSTPLPATSTAAKTEGTKASSIATSATSTPTSFNTPPVDNTTFTSTKSSAAPNVTIISSGLPEPKPASATATSTNPPTSAAPSDPTDSIFGSLNICKSNTKESADSAKSISGVGATSTTATPAAFSFATASGAGDGATSFLGSTPATTTSSGFSFGSTTNSSTTESVFGKPTAIEGAASTAATTITTTSTTNSTSASSTASSTTTTAAVTTKATSFSFGTTPTTTSAGSLFGSHSLSSTTEPNAAAATTATAATASGNIFGGGGSSIFGQSTSISTAASTTSTTTSIFGGGAAAATSAPSLFGSTAPATAAAATPGTGNIFGGIPKPDQSVFGSTSSPAQSAGTGIFAAAAATTKPPAATGASIFGGGSTTGFGAPSGASGGSIFGGGNATSATSPFGSPASAANTASSIFGAAAAATKPVEGGNIFGSPTQQSAASGGSIFGQSTFGQAAAPQSSGSIFGGAASQSPTAGGFGASGGSIFGGSTSANNSASGGSLFGGAAAATASAFGSSASSPGFGSFSQPSGASAFGSPTAGGYGAPASTGFGSPQQQSAFAKPVFSGPATFGTSPQPAFGGAQPTFGGAPTFGSPKGFGTFTATSPTAATGFGAAATAAPKGNIFETLGSQDTGLSFGNLAHSTQPPQQKPTFGGSSFTSYRS